MLASSSFHGRILTEAIWGSPATLAFGLKFLCRQCQQLAYASQRERSFDRASRRAIKD